jgi:copper homeostasis protein
MPRPKVEICLTELASARAAREGGADRIELCADLASGGITPSLGMILTVASGVLFPVHVLIRPRPGDFVYDLDDTLAMVADIQAAKDQGAAGVVVGVLQEDGKLDLDATALLADSARPMSVTFHKAIDLTPDPLAALDGLIALGIDRILTSGGPGPARDNLRKLRAMVERAAGRILVMAGGGIRESDIPHLIEATGVPEIHLGSAVTGPAEPPGPFCARAPRVEAERVRRVIELLSG